MIKTAIEFDQAYEALMGFAPYPWQQRLYKRIVASDWPDALDIPTGLGKTSVMAIWLIALAAGGDVPRRLVYVVNRRTIVDQATGEAQRMLGLLYRSGHRDGATWGTEQAMHRLGLLHAPALSEADVEVVANLRDALARLGGDANVAPLAISTLRGELADNGEWRSNPARPAIVVGTVDLIGSELLFRGYRTSWRSRSFQAGLLGHDSLILHDEAHLTQPFQALLDDISTRWQWSQPRRLRCMAMSATGEVSNEAGVHRLTDEDRSQPRIDARLNATKRLFLHEADKLVDAIAERALSYVDQRVKVVVYVHSPEDAARVEKKLESVLKKTAASRLALLTGTIRGRERDRLLTDSAMRHFLASAQPLGEDADGAVYLVSTSAGEVGVDLDADHMVGDLVPADALVQRLGRVNRRGGDGRAAEIHIYAEPSFKDDDAYHEARAATAAVLRNKGADTETPTDAGPEATQSWVTESTRTPRPETLPLTEAGLEALALTSIADDWPIVPDVASLLHGLVDDLPQTTVLWRTELEALQGQEAVDDAMLRQVFRKHPPLSHERLTVQTGRLVTFLKDRVKQHLKTSDSGENAKDLPHAVILGQEASWLPLDAESVQEQGLKATLRFKTLVLPPVFGGLNSAGMLDATADPPKDSSLDVADESGDRLRVIRNEDEDADEIERLLVGDGKVPRDRGRLTLTIPFDERQRKSLRFYRKVEKEDARRTATDPPSVDAHNQAVHDLAEQYADALQLEPALKQSLMDAGAAHDLGKRRALWQSAAGHFDPHNTYAKTRPGRSLNWRDLQHYRHELGSLLDTDASDDLTLHLIASHHGRARPHFREPMFDPERPPSAYPDPAKVACRFARLQRQHGHWGLAWLEALLRAADRAASSEVTAEEDNA